MGGLAREALGGSCGQRMSQDEQETQARAEGKLREAVRGCTRAHRRTCAGPMK